MSAMDAICFVLKKFSREFVENSRMFRIYTWPSVAWAITFPYSLSMFINDPRYDCFYEYADAHGLPILFHAWEAVDSVHIAQVAKRFPLAKLIIGHGAMRTWEVKREVISAVRKYDNVFADTTVSVAFDGAVEWIVNEIGADRLCYGSDIPFYDCRHVVGKVATAKLTDTEKRKILGENAGRILGLPQPPGEPMR